jgi:oligopeptide/dipeptide ABC transporter ATP-binding protein
VVGESGSGKSTLGRLAIALEQVSTGRVLFDGEDIADAATGRRLDLRRRARMVFQDPQSSLNRSLAIAESLESPLRVHAPAMSARERRERVGELLELVGLGRDMAGRFPHELSGGQRQRVGIARALAVEPDFVVLDEPTSALDVSIQAQIVNLLLGLQRRMGLAYLFISHDLRLVRWLCDRIAVMYLGRIVEIGPAAEVWATPRHPYTRVLLAASGDDATAPGARGDPPSPIRPPSGCAFHTRCPSAGPRCARERPATRSIAGVDVACHLHDGGTG